MRPVAILAVTAAGLVAAGCATARTGSVDPAGIDVRKTMDESINPSALAIWEVGNGATDEEGAPDASKLDAAAIARRHEAAVSMSDTARRLAEASVIRASGPDLVGGVMPEGVASRAQIQAAIDANPEGFRAYARAMGGQADAIAAAADRKDAKALAELVTSFDGACQGCHEKYWYVSQ